MKVLISYSKSKPKALENACVIQTYLTSIGVEHLTINIDEMIACSTSSNNNIFDIDLSQIELSIVLGGDGTILRCARLLQGHYIPILGINLGNLGFLANDLNNNLIDLVSKALAGELVEEDRTNLMCDIICEGEEDWIENSCMPARSPFFALNEVTVSRGDAGYMLNMLVDISGAAIGRFKGDGMIVASATGSTAYSLAAGGPIVAPSFHGLIVQPLVSHTISARTILTNKNDIVQIKIEKNHENLDISGSIFVDGIKANLPSPPKIIYVRSGETPTILLYESTNTTLKKATTTFFRSLKD